MSNLRGEGQFGRVRPPVLGAAAPHQYRDMSVFGAPAGIAAIAAPGILQHPVRSGHGGCIYWDETTPGNATWERGVARILPAGPWCWHVEAYCIWRLLAAAFGARNVLRFGASVRSNLDLTVAPPAADIGAAISYLGAASNDQNTELSSFTIAAGTRTAAAMVGPINNHFESFNKAQQGHIWLTRNAAGVITLTMNGKGEMPRHGVPATTLATGVTGAVLGIVSMRKDGGHITGRDVHMGFWDELIPVRPSEP